MLADLSGHGVEVTSLTLGPIDDGAVSAWRPRCNGSTASPCPGW